jgi:hypothetical protein
MSKQYHVTWQTFLLPLPFIVVSVMAAQALNRLEHGETKMEFLPTPLVWVYEQFGYWPTVLIPALAGLTFLILATLVYFNERKNHHHASEAPSPPADAAKPSQ